MIVAPRRSLGESKHKCPSVLWALVFVLALSGCGGGGGSGPPKPPPETMRQVMLDKINEIQGVELGHIDRDDVVDHIEEAASSDPRGLSSGSLNVSSTTQSSVYGRRVAVVADHDADGTLHFSAQFYSDNSSTFTRSSTRDQIVSFNRLNGIPAEGWKGVEIREESGNWNDYVDLFSDIEESGDTDYLALGFWMRERREKIDTPFNYNYRFEVFAGGNDAFESSNLARLTGSATYEGPATGLHMKQNAAGVPVFDYFNATANLTADFSDSANSWKYIRFNY